jgi:transposase
MNRRPRRNHSPAFKAKVALAAIKGERSPQSDYGLEIAA